MEKPYENLCPAMFSDSKGALTCPRGGSTRGRALRYFNLPLGGMWLREGESHLSHGRKCQKGAAGRKLQAGSSSWQSAQTGLRGRGLLSWQLPEQAGSSKVPWGHLRV